MSNMNLVDKKSIIIPKNIMNLFDGIVFEKI